MRNLPCFLKFAFIIMYILTQEDFFMSIYDQIKHDISQEYYQTHYSNDGQRFIAWYLRNVYELDSAEAKDCITDGADDKQIDAVYISEQDEKIYIIQGKFLQRGKVDAEPLREIHSAWTQIKNLQNLQENANDKLAGKAGEIYAALENGCDLCFELIMTSELTKPAKKDAEIFRQEMADDDDLSATLAVIDAQGVESRYKHAVSKNGSGINYDFVLEPGMFMEVTIAGKKAVIAILSLRECLKIPGIDNGLLFRKNVRQSLGNNVKVNKEIAKSLKTAQQDFFFMHNGITAICSSMEVHDNILSAQNLSVVNGCQSLTTIYSNSIAISNSDTEGYITFRFYEIDDSERADTISTSTNSQNAVKPRDLRSNDKYILMLKRAYEQQYPDGQLITKRGEKAESDKNKLHIVELTVLGKMLITWHMQKPTVVHEEAQIFSTHFNLLFHREYMPENVQALNEIFSPILELWKPKNNNPLDFNEELFKNKAYAPYWHLFTVSALLCEINKQPDSVPVPERVLKVMKENGVLDEVIEIAGNCVNEAFMKDVDEARENTRVFNTPNWLKSSRTVNAVRSVIRTRLKPLSQAEKILISELREKLKMSKRDFGAVWKLE